MLRNFYGLLLAAAFASFGPSVSAFSIMGSRATWMTPSIGYAPAGTPDVGGPMFLGEGYRWNVPVVTYAFDDSFLQYFGASGVAAVESAIKILNDLPAADAMSTSLDEFPLQTLRHNASASAFGLIDLKTMALSHLLQRVGVGAPERWVYSIRQFFTDPANIQHFSILNLNYDPVTLRQSAYINGSQFTWLVDRYAPGDFYTTVNFPVDPTAPAFTTAANFIQAFAGDFFVTQGGDLIRSPGVYFQSLTREDVAAYRYLYRSGGYAVETVLPDVVGGTIAGISVGTVGTNPSGGGGGDQIWQPTFSVATAGGGGNSSWGIVYSSVGTNTTAGGTTAVVTGTTNSVPFVSTALRPGVGKISFARIGWDSVLSATTKPYAVTWTDRYITNGVIRTQKLSRSLTRPDFLFSAGDLGTVNHIPFIFLEVYQNDGFVNNSQINRAGTAGELAGPGIINTGNDFVFSKVGRYYRNEFGVGSTQDDSRLGISFGSFDGSTNAIIAYPDGASIKALEAQVLRGR